MRVLLVEHNPDCAALTSGALHREGIDCEIAPDEAAGAEFLASRGPFHALLLDYSMPSAALQFLLEARRAGHELPAILLCPPGHAQVAGAAVRAGVADYLVKSPDLTHLELLPGALLRVARAGVASARKPANRQAGSAQLAQPCEDLQRLILVDPLTGLYNRRFLPDALCREFAASSRYGHPLSCAMADIDHFKDVNDAHGHMTGDEVLQGVADLIRRSFREPDLAFRYGGEEFTILLPHSDVPAALAACERLLDEMRSRPFATTGGELAVKASIGLACLQNDNFASPEELIAASDVALYQAKHGGRDRVVVASGSRRSADPAKLAA
jgi:diguanylate cyclase (GGDEF)-like protein